MKRPRPKIRLNECLNVPKLICIHLMGEQHTCRHHMAVGLLLMVVGVMLAKYSAGVHIYVVHYGGDLLGYGLHGIGLTPWLEALNRMKS